MAAKIYLTGASGRLGQFVLKRTGAVPIVRKPSGLENEIVSDFSEEELSRIFSDAKAIIHLAGSRDFLDIAKARKGNVELTKNVVLAAPENAKIIFSSSISVYGKKLSALPADESTPVHPDTAYAKTKLEAEGIVSSHANHVILRIGPVYGEGFEEYFKVLRMIEKGKMKIIGRGDNRIPFVHAEDAASAIANALEKGIGTYVIVGECLSQEEIFAIAAKALGAPKPKEHISRFIATLFSHYQLFRKNHLGGSATFIPEDVAVLSSDRAFNCNKARRELGFSPRPIEKGIIEMATSYRKRNKS
jgi:nucleoside-diphosphate-sugar epimerase